ncbi:hypothetical protein ABZ519_19260 [Streptomyces collinus]|uniref:hypothetical protein n=1 Tax=Streptomyces collinus TaxID=42684 RepID=UPI0033CC11E9
MLGLLLVSKRGLPQTPPICAVDAMGRATAGPTVNLAASHLSRLPPQQHRPGEAGAAREAALLEQFRRTRYATACRQVSILPAGG